MTEIGVEKRNNVSDLRAETALSRGHSLLRAYPIAAEVDYEIYTSGTFHRGRGLTVSLSRSVVVFEASQSLPIGKRIDLSIAWPVLLHDEVRLRLWVSGAVVESHASRIIVRIYRHEFRTRRSAVCSG